MSDGPSISPEQAGIKISEATPKARQHDREGRPLAEDPKFEDGKRYIFLGHEPFARNRDKTPRILKNFDPRPYHGESYNPPVSEHLSLAYTAPSEAEPGTLDIVKQFDPADARTRRYRLVERLDQTAEIIAQPGAVIEVVDQGRFGYAHCRFISGDISEILPPGLIGITTLPDVATRVKKEKYSAFSNEELTRLIPDLQQKVWGIPLTELDREQFKEYDKKKGTSPARYKEGLISSLVHRIRGR